LHYLSRTLIDPLRPELASSLQKKKKDFDLCTGRKRKRRFENCRHDECSLRCLDDSSMKEVRSPEDCREKKRVRGWQPKSCRAVVSSRSWNSSWLKEKGRKERKSIALVVQCAIYVLPRSMEKLKLESSSECNPALSASEDWLVDSRVFVCYL
jgi:uncharacterized protein YhaN